MITKETLKNIVQSQAASLSGLEPGVEREKLHEINPKLPFAIILSGIRRCGKSTLLHQMMKQKKCIKTKLFIYLHMQSNLLKTLETRI